MLSLRHDTFTNETRLYIHTKHGEAWIARKPRQHPDERVNWRIWVRQPGLPAQTGKSPRRLLIESELRAWLLRRYKRCLRTLSFDHLCAIAAHEAGSRRGRSDVGQ
jgi:hypothetical protein